jgi:hypothetical protein
LKHYDCPGAYSLADHIALHEARLTTETAVKIVMTTWFVVAAVNMWIGVARAGYSFTGEPPIFRLPFLLPTVATIVIKWEFF